METKHTEMQNTYFSGLILEVILWIKINFIENFVELRRVRDNENHVSGIILYRTWLEDKNLKGLIRINQNKCYNGSAGQTKGVRREMKRKEN